jgi:hypothetical protein
VLLKAGLTKPGEVGEILTLYRLKSVSLDYKAKSAKKAKSSIQTAKNAKSSIPTAKKTKT